MFLGVNIDHVATLRQARKSLEPDPVLAARICEAAGADSIVVHLREDRRHIQDRDVELLRRTVKTRLNLEMSIAKEIVDIACHIKPDQATLVPEKRQELTTEGGLDVAGQVLEIKKAVERLKKRSIAVSLFIDAQKKQIDAVLKTGAGCIELHTGAYAQAKNISQQKKHLRDLICATDYARKNGLAVFAGHGLDYLNVQSVAKIKGITELNIGYAIICRAVFSGLSNAVKEMKRLI